MCSSWSKKKPFKFLYLFIMSVFMEWDWMVWIEVILTSIHPCMTTAGWMFCWFYTLGSGRKVWSFIKKIHKNKQPRQFSSSMDVKPDNCWNAPLSRSDAFMTRFRCFSVSCPVQMVVFMIKVSCRPILCSPFSQFHFCGHPLRPPWC